MKNRKAKKTAGALKELLSMSIYLLVIIAGTLLIRTFVFERSLVVGQSMEPTLYDGENLLIEKISHKAGLLNRFDIIVFDHGDEFLIKRVYGLPGESIRIDDTGLIYVNDKVIDDKYAYSIMEDQGIAKDSGITLKDDEYFVLGDNRNHSTDSRYREVGPVREDRIRGKVFFRLYPFGRMGTIK